MDTSDIERVIRLGMCSPGKLAEGCACCAAKLAAVEAVRALHERAERAEAEVERARGMLAARGIRVATLEEVADRWVRERDKARAEVERLRAVMAPDPTLCAGGPVYQGAREAIGAECDEPLVPACERVRRERDALREQVETLTRERDAYRADVATADQVIADLRRERDEARASRDEHVSYYASLDEDIRAALGPHATGDLVADVRRLVAIVDTYLHSAESSVIGAVLRAADHTLRTTQWAIGSLHDSVTAWRAAGRPGLRAIEADLASEDMSARGCEEER